MFLNIFTSLEVLFFCLGVFTTLTVIGLIWLRQRHDSTWGQLTTLGAGVFVLILAFAWLVSSVIEGEPQSGSMGLMIIGLPGLLLTSLGGRMVFNDLNRAEHA